MPFGRPVSWGHAIRILLSFEGLSSSLRKLQWLLCLLSSCDPAGLLQGSLGPFRPEVSPGVSPRVFPGTGVSPGVFHRVSPGSGVSRKCPKSVPRVSPECRKGVPDTLGTLSGHFLDTPEPRARRASETLCGKLPETPRLSGTLTGTLPDTLRARRAGETPVAGRRGRNSPGNISGFFSLQICLRIYLSIF